MRLHIRRLAPHSLRARLTLWHLLVLGAALLLFSFVLYGMLARSLYAQVDQSLVERADQVSGFLLHGDRFRHPDQDGTIPIPPPDTFASADTFVQIADANGAVLGASDALGSTMMPVDAVTLRDQTPHFQTVKLSGETIREYSAPIVLQGQVFVVQVGRSLTGMENTLRAVELIAFGAFLIALLLSGLVVSAMARSTLKPLEQLVATAEAVGSSGDLSTRVRVPATRDEVGKLAATFNRMLARLQDSDAHLRETLESQRRFVADASHELRTPLTTIRGNAALLRQIPDMEDEDKGEALEEIHVESERMSRLVNDLLTLARADGGLVLKREGVELAPLVESVTSQVARLSEGVRVSVESVDPVQVYGDSDALRQLLLILLDNAVKYTPEGGRVSVRLDRQGDEAAVSVSDTGAGIEPEHLPHIFERFYRADPARTTGGTGLGLSIAQWIAERHAGRIVVASTPGRGSTFTVQLPVTNVVPTAPRPASTVTTSVGGQAPSAAQS